jgi:hypothetical protein
LRTPFSRDFVLDFGVSGFAVSAARDFFLTGRAGRTQDINSEGLRSEGLLDLEDLRDLTACAIYPSQASRLSYGLRPRRRRDRRRLSCRSGASQSRYVMSNPTFKRGRSKNNKNVSKRKLPIARFLSEENKPYRAKD